MHFSAIVAVSKNNVIGAHGKLPWGKMSADLKYFKEKTMGHWCVLGRKSYNALGNKSLPGRKFIVVSRDKNFISDDSIVVHTIHDAIHHEVLKDEKEVMVLGGGEIYNQSIKYLSRIYLTKINAELKGDTYFPELKKSEWKVVSANKFSSDEKNPYDYEFLIYDRK